MIRLDESFGGKIVSTHSLYVPIFPLVIYDDLLGNRIKPYDCWLWIDIVGK